MTSRRASGRCRRGANGHGGLGLGRVARGWCCHSTAVVFARSRLRFGPEEAPCLGRRGGFMIDRLYCKACTTVYD